MASKVAVMMILGMSMTQDPEDLMPLAGKFSPSRILLRILLKEHDLPHLDNPKPRPRSTISRILLPLDPH
jgi:hypothetical protein